MKTKFLNSFRDIFYWIDIFVCSLWGIVILILDIPWYIILLNLFISGVMIFLLKSRKTQDNNHIERKLKCKVKMGLKRNDALQIYKLLDEEMLPVIRGQLPLRIYKYYSLGIDENVNLRKIETIKSNSIWSSVYSEFNDPFECHYMYLSEKKFNEMGASSEGKQLWDSLMEEIRNRITTICFTENPNSMPMWAHYANEHKGFCIEYEIIDKSNLYPVVYVKKRIQTFSLLIELIYNLFCGDAKARDRSAVFKHIMFLSAFKHENWEYEKEIRAIFLNTKLDSNEKGKVVDCDRVGVQPVKVYIGVKCNDENRKLLISMAKALNIEYENCTLSIGEEFSVLENM